MNAVAEPGLLMHIAQIVAKSPFAGKSPEPADPDVEDEQDLEHSPEPELGDRIPAERDYAREVVGELVVVRG